MNNFVSVSEEKFVYNIYVFKIYDLKNCKIR